MKPALMPALPNPAIARPVMKALDVGDVAQINEPTSKMRIETKNTFLIE